MQPIVTKGSRIRLLSMPDDPDPIPAGSEGVVIEVCGGSLPQLEVRWDCGRSLSLIPGVDRFIIIEPKE